MILFRFFKLFFFLFLFQITSIVAAVPSGTAESGILDLSAYNDPQPVKLNGEWIFSWKNFNNEFSRAEKAQYIKVPGSWSKFTGSGLFEGNFGYCSYALKVILPAGRREWKLLLPPINSAYRLYVNGVLKASAGVPASGSHMIAAVEPQSVQFFLPGRELLITIQVSNYHFIAGGIWSPLILGSPKSVENFQKNQNLISAFLIGSLLMMGLYHFSLFFLWKRDKGPLFFGLICCFIALRESFAGPGFFYLLFPDLNYELSIKLLYFSFPVCLMCFILFFETLYPRYSRIVKWLGLFASLCYIIAILLFKNTFYGGYLPVISIMFVVQIIHLLYLVFNKRSPSKQENILVLSGILTLFFCFGNDVLFEMGYIRSYFLLPFGFFIFTLFQSILLAIRFSAAFYSSERLSIALTRSEELKSIEEIKNRFFSNITHELRTPLSLIISPVEQLMEKRKDDSLLTKSLASIYRNAGSLLMLINQLLDLAKLESGHMKTVLQKGQINLFFEQVIETFKPYATERGIEICFKPVQDTRLLFFDAEKIEKILYNLISNAIKFNQTGGEVEISLEVLDGVIMIGVKDTGIGIPEDIQETIFERFVQADNGTYVRGGTGIGLALVKELVDFLGGSIQVSSRIAEGTQINLRIPVQDAGPAAGVSEPLPLVSVPLYEYVKTNSVWQMPKKDRTDTILLVEDHPELMDFIGTALSEHYHVLTAANGAEAWEICLQEMPVLVISDIMMPVMNGFDLCKNIKESAQTDHIGVILLTAKSAIDSKIEGLSCKANDYLTKPFHFPELLLRIQNFLQYQQTLRAYYRRELVSFEPAADEKNLPPFLVKLYKYIEYNIDNSELSIEELAAELAVSSKTLNRKLSSLIGMNANEAIKNFRLKKAAQLLRSGSNISETAYQVGFESPSYFGQCFKDVYAITPSEFQKRKYAS